MDCAGIGLTQVAWSACMFNDRVHQAARALCVPANVSTAPKCSCAHLKKEGKKGKKELIKTSWPSIFWSYGWTCYTWKIFIFLNCFSLSTPCCLSNFNKVRLSASEWVSPFIKAGVHLAGIPCMQRRESRTCRAECQGSPGNDSWQRSLSNPTPKQDSSLGHAESLSGGGCVVWEKEQKEWRGAFGVKKKKKMLQKQKPLALTFTHTPPLREEGTGSGSLCLRTPEKKKKEHREHQGGGEGKTERERVSGGLRPATNSLDWNVQQKKIYNKSRRRRIVSQKERK